LDDKYLKPKEIDRVLQGLLAVADSDTSDLAFIEPLVLFLDDLSEKVESSIFEHYCTLYSPVVLRALRKVPPSSLSYDVLTRLPSLIARIQELAPEVMTPDDGARLGETYENLAFYELLLGNEDKALGHLGKAHEIDPRQIGLQEKLKLLKEKYSQFQTHSSADEIKFVAVYSSSGSGPQTRLGKIITAKSRIDITGEWSTFKRFKRIIAFEGRTLRTNDPFDDQLATAVDCAEGHFKKRLRIGEIERLPREYHFSLLDGESSSNLKTRFTGGSAGLAFALLSLSSIDVLGVRRDRRFIRSSVVFTGSVESDGSVRSVDNSALAAKVRSVFLSPCSCLVLPKDNLPAATAALADMQTQYPKRSFELVPVAHVLDAYDDERIVERKSFSTARVMLNKAKRRKKHLAVAFSFLITLITLLLFLPPRVARETSKYWFTNGQVHFENRYSYDFGQYAVGYRVLDVPPKDNPAIDPDDTQSKAYQFFSGDVSGDGSNELLFASIESDSTETNHCGRFHVHLFANDGRLLLPPSSWLDSLVHAGGGERNVFRKFYFCHGGLIDLNGDNRKDHFAFSLTDRDSYPGVIGIVSLRDSSIQSFAHVGYLPRFAAGDFDGDGAKEIVAGGTSNGLNAAVIAVLDPAHMNGSSPAIYQRQFENLGDDVAKYYIKLPRSALCGIPEMKVDKPEVTRINVDEDAMPTFAVTEKDCTLIFSFDRNWRCTGIVPHSSYKSQYELLQKAYHLPELNSHLKDLKNQVEYWTGTDWVRTPTMNGSYLKLVSQKSEN
jgi:hypothetical protein